MQPLLLHKLGDLFIHFAHHILDLKCQGLNSEVGDD
jgi:hypothetical protein